MHELYHIADAQQMRTFLLFAHPLIIRSYYSLLLFALGLFRGYVGLFCRCVGLFCEYVGLFIQYTTRYEMAQVNVCLLLFAHLGLLLLFALIIRSSYYSVTYAQKVLLCLLLLPYARKVLLCNECRRQVMSRTQTGAGSRQMYLCHLTGRCTCAISYRVAYCIKSPT